MNGTRIIGRKTLSSAELFINTHTGITPKYRGVHGGYWALVSRDPGNFGTTIHLVDAGVDTGTVLARVRTGPTPRDTFATYPALQLLAALPTLLDVVNQILQGTLPEDDEKVKPSVQWFHPTLLQYVVNGVTKGVW